ncbi:MAG TPA: hypothetical protein VKG92_02770, partial [Flavobacteriales bacterium]|nr:hypothetical protein [Flavobacteriales bacterium]
MQQVTIRSFHVALLLLLGSAIAHAQCANGWVRTGGGPDHYDRALAVAADSLGNTYVAGQFNGSATFGDTTLVSTSSEDIYLAKYALDGDLIWIRAMGSQGTDQVNDLLVLTDDLVVLAGSSNSTVTFGAFTHTNTSGWPDAYMVAFTGSGDVSWFTAIAGTGSDLCTGLARYGTSTTFVATGSYEGTLLLGPTLIATGSRNTFVCEVTFDGAVQWARSIACSGAGSSAAVALPAAATVVVSGGFSGTITFNGSTHTSAGSSDGFLATYTIGGDELDVLTFGSALEDSFGDIAAGSDGEVFASFIFSNSVQVGSIPLTSVGDKDAGIVRVQASDLSCTHAVQIGGADRDYLDAIAYSPTGVVLATGSVNGSASIGGIDVVSTPDDNNIYYALFNASDLSSTSAAITGGPLGYDQGIGIAVDRSYNITVVGEFAGSTTFDGTATTADVNGGDAFVWRLCATAVGIEEAPAPLLDLTVRPVPNDGHFSVVLDNALGGPALLRVLDSSGRVVHQLSI